MFLNCPRELRKFARLRRARELHLNCQRRASGVEMAERTKNSTFCAKGNLAQVYREPYRAATLCILGSRPRVPYCHFKRLQRKLCLRTPGPKALASPSQRRHSAWGKTNRDGDDINAVTFSPAETQSLECAPNLRVGSPQGQAINVGTGACESALPARCRMLILNEENSGSLMGSLLMEAQEVVEPSAIDGGDAAVVEPAIGTIGYVQGAVVGYYGCAFG